MRLPSKIDTVYTGENSIEFRNPIKNNLLKQPNLLGSIQKIKKLARPIQLKRLINFFIGGLTEKCFPILLGNGMDLLWSGL